MKEIIVIVPDDISEDDIAEYLQRNSDEYEGAFDKSVAEHGDRAEVFEVEATEVEIDQHSVVVNYEVSWGAYYGCRDMNDSGIEHRHVTGTRDGRIFTFQEHIYLERSTYDEF